MPDADGLAVAGMIRERAELAATRIILLTSGERPGDPARFRELRIDAQLLKPVQQDELLETIYRVMSRSQGNAPPLAWPTSRQQAGAAPNVAACMQGVDKTGAVICRKPVLRGRYFFPIMGEPLGGAQAKANDIWQPSKKAK